MSEAPIRGQRLQGASVAVDSLAKAYVAGGTRIEALAGVTLNIDPGALVAVTGPSGSGKSTLLHLIGAMDDADSGRVVVDGDEVTSLTRRAQTSFRRRIGFVFQRFHLLSVLTALDNVIAPLLPYRTEFDKAERGTELLAAVGLRGREESLPSELSGGEQQRVAIARALVNNPVLLLADEPTGNLDSKTGTAIMELLLELRARRKMTVIVATHDTVIASRCERIVRLLDGRVLDDVDVAAGEPEQVLERISRIEP